MLWLWWAILWWCVAPTEAAQDQVVSGPDTLETGEIPQGSCPIVKARKAEDYGGIVIETANVTGWGSLLPHLETTKADGGVCAGTQGFGPGRWKTQGNLVQERLEVHLGPSPGH